MLDALAADPNFSLMAERILGMKDELPEVKATTQYKPEYSWNYEIGSHLTLWEGKLWADLAAFYMDTRDQQISQMAESGHNQCRKKQKLWCRSCPTYQPDK